MDLEVINKPRDLHKSIDAMHDDHHRVFDTFQTVGMHFPQGPNLPQGKLVDILVVTEGGVYYDSHLSRLG